MVTVTQERENLNKELEIIEKPNGNFRVEKIQKVRY